jgi:hypothetical protein
MIRLNWLELKNFISGKNIHLQYIERATNYHIIAIDGDLQVETHVKKTSPANADQTDFETNYKSAANTPMTEVDSEGRRHIRQAAAKKGWSYLAHVIEFETSTLNGCYSKNWQEVDRGDVVMKFYNSSDVELVAGTQAELDANCVKTVITWSPSYDYELIGGNIHQRVSPATDVRLWVVGGAPELGALGVREFVGGLNLYYMGADEAIETDGRASKYMKKTTTGVPFNTNQMQTVIRHDIGMQHKIKLLLEYFRA